MNLIDPHSITPEVLRRAVELYCADIHPATRPYHWTDDDNEMGLDGRFNLSLLGRCIEEAILLDAVTHLKASSAISKIERVVRRQMTVEHSRLEYDRFIKALATALGKSVGETEAFIRPIRRAFDTVDPFIRQP